VGLSFAPQTLRLAWGFFLLSIFFFLKQTKTKKKILFFCDIKIGEEFGCDYSLFRC